MTVITRIIHVVGNETDIFRAELGDNSRISIVGIDGMDGNIKRLRVCRACDCVTRQSIGGPSGDRPSVVGGLSGDDRIIGVIGAIETNINVFILIGRRTEIIVFDDERVGEAVIFNAYEI